METGFADILPTKPSGGSEGAKSMGTGILQLLTAILYGAVEGVTEWLPVSSTGHLLLLREILPPDTAVTEEFFSVFLVVVQLGAVLAVAVLYGKQIFPIALRAGRPVLRREVCLLWGKIVLACLPGVLYALTLDERIGDRFYGYRCVSVMLITVGLLFLVSEALIKRRGSSRPAVTEAAAIPWKTAVGIGVFQLVAAVFPGTSRSGATILSGLWLGLSRTAAAEFTFYLALPVMAGESCLRLFSGGSAFSPWEWTLLLAGTVTAFLVSLIVIRFLLDYVRRHDFRVFAWYRIALGLAVLWYFSR